jgi:N-acetylglucosaminyl-diphospho-decaprenol L-rhamnosyltransferase
MNARVTIVSVTYNSSSVVRLMLSSIPDGTPVVLVDNNSKDQSELEMISIES